VGTGHRCGLAGQISNFTNYPALPQHLHSLLLKFDSCYRFIYKRYSLIYYIKQNPPDMRKKSDLPSKICPVCSKPFAWRKKWERDWDNVKYCSERCRRSAPSAPQG